MASSIVVVTKIDFVAGDQESVVIHYLFGQPCLVTCQTECQDKHRLQELLSEEEEDDEY